MPGSGGWAEPGSGTGTVLIMADCSDGAGEDSEKSQTPAPTATVRPSGVHGLTATHADLLDAGPDSHEDVPEKLRRRLGLGGPAPFLLKP
ncbi:hypothetical protein [Streptomyces sviceus]|uniref:hypothetical protein n=1 Tax=Streptomyces sviceus TaxID=285530 RepID=UPI003323CBEF